MKYHLNVFIVYRICPFHKHYNALISYFGKSNMAATEGRHPWAPLLKLFSIPKSTFMQNFIHLATYIIWRTYIKISINTAIFPNIFFADGGHFEK